MTFFLGNKLKNLLTSKSKYDIIHLLNETERANMENTTYNYSSFEADREQLKEQIDKEIQDIKSQVENKKETFWCIVSRKVLQNLKADKIKKEDVNTIYYKGVDAKVWSFVDNNLTYEFRKENVSAKGGYIRYRFTLQGDGCQEAYESDTYYACCDSQADGYIQILTECLETYTSKKQTKEYYENRLKELNDIIDKMN